MEDHIGLQQLEDTERALKAGKTLVHYGHDRVEEVKALEQMELAVPV